MNPWTRLQALLQPAGVIVGTVQESSSGRSEILTKSGVSIWVDGTAEIGKTAVVDAGRIVRIIDTMTFYDIEV